MMRIAATYENGEIFQHFGHTEQLKVYDTENGEILSSNPTPAATTAAAITPAAEAR